MTIRSDADLAWLRRIGSLVAQARDLMAGSARVGMRNLERDNGTGRL